MLLLYSQPFRTASIFFGISQSPHSVPCEDCPLEKPPCLPEPDEQCRQLETNQAFEHYFLERRLFL